MGKNTGRFFTFFYFGYFEEKLNWKTELKMEISQGGFWFITLHTTTGLCRCQVLHSSCIMNTK